MSLKRLILTLALCLPAPCAQAGTPFRGAPFAVPGSFEAEDFDLGGEGIGYHDLTIGNAGGVYRPSEDVDLYAPAAGTVAVNNFQTAEWLAYSIDVAQSGSYRIEPKVSSLFTASRYHLTIDGADVSGQVAVPSTGSWASYQYAGVGGISLAAGRHELRIYCDLQYFNLDSFRITAEALPPPPPAGRILYVDAQAGNDASDGLSAATPWKTVGKASGSVRPGDTVYLAGTFTAQRILPQASGTTTAPIRYTCWPGRAATFVGGIYETNCSVAGRAYITIDHLTLQDAGQDGVSLVQASHITLSSCRILRERIEIIRASDNLIQGNTIQDYGSETNNAGDCLWLSNGASRNRILSNTITNGGHSCILIGGDQVGDLECGDNVVAHNTISNRWAMPLALNWMARRTLVEYNQIRDATKSGVNYPRYGITIQASGNVIRYNDIVGNTGGGIQLAAYTYAGSITQDSIGNQIYNNTIYGNGGCGVQMSINNGRQIKDNLIVNNLLFGNGGLSFGGSVYSLWIDFYHNGVMWPAGSLNGNRIQNNSMLRAPGSAGERAVILVPPGAVNDRFYTLPQFQAAYPAEAKDNLEADPLFMDAAGGDFRLQPGSSAIDAGQAVPGGAPYRGAAPDMGAHEYGG